MWLLYCLLRMELVLIYLQEVFQEEGIYEKRLSFHGFASYQPLVKIDNLKGKELKAARKKNRRVVIKVY